MQIDVWTLVFQIVNFLVLVWLLHRLLYRPVLNLLEERRRRERETLEKAEQLAAEAKAERERYEQARAELLEERWRLRELVMAETESERRRLLEEARAGLAREREAFLRELEHARRQALVELRAEVAGILEGFARRLAEALRSPALDEAFFRRLLARLEQQKGALADGLVLRCASEPDDLRTALYRERLAALSGGRVPEIRVDPELRAGVVLESGSLHAAFTLAEVIDDARRRILATPQAAAL